MSEQNSATVAAPSTTESSTPETSTEVSQSQELQSSETPPAPAVEAKKRLKQLQLKIDGEEVMEDLPFEIDEDQADWMKKNLQLSKKAQKSMQSESQLRSQVDQFVKSLKGDTKNTLKQMGIDPREFAAAIIEEELQQQAMSPEQREKAELQSKLKALEEERAREKEEFNQKELSRLQQVEYENIDNKMTSVIEKAGIPKSPYVVKKIAQYMLDGLKENVNLQPEDVIDLVKSEVYSDIKELIAALGDNAEEFLGKEIFEKQRKKNLAKAKTTPASIKAAIKDVGASKKSDTKPQEKVSIKEFFKL